MKKKEKNRILNSFGKLKEDGFDFENIDQYFKRKDHTGNLQVISDKQCEDLDFYESFMYIDHTVSRVGQQVLYNTLRVLPGTTGHFEKWEYEIEKINKNKDLREKTMLALSKLSNDESYSIISLFRDSIPDITWKHQLLKVFPVLSVTMFIVTLVMPKMLYALLGIFIINLIVHYRNKKNLQHYLTSIPELLKLNRTAKELLSTDTTLEQNNLKDSIRVIDKLKSRVAVFKMESSLSGDIESLVWGVLELIKIFFLIEPILLFNVLKLLKTRQEDIERVYLFVGECDTVLSIASLREGLTEYAIPEITDDRKYLYAENVYHPLIPDCVSNTITMHNKSVLLTGSNMSGKTTFIRTIGLNTLFALTINTVFAKRFVIPYVKIYTAIRISDDLLNDKSYYFEEVLTIKKMIDESSDNSFPKLFLLDEIFKGTNTVERISAGKAVLSTLNKANNLVFVSTHDIELTDFLHDEYDLYHFSEIVDDEDINFDYLLKEGKLTNRNAIKILELNGFPKDVISEAVCISKELDQYTLTRFKE
jgi:hypothetical protein